MAGDMSSMVMSMVAYWLTNWPVEAKRAQENLEAAAAGENMMQIQCIEVKPLVLASFCAGQVHMASFHQGMA